MQPRSFLILLIVMSAGLLAAGCEQSSVDGGLLESDRGTEPEISDQSEPADLPLITLDELPLRFPGAATERSDGTEDSPSPDDLNAEDPGAPGLIETLRGTVDASPIFEEADADETLLDSLDAAQSELDRSKRNNLRAIREANRQVRIGSAANTPHLVLITLGDVAYADFGCYGGQSATPNLDEFASQGMRFTDFYASSSDPLAARWSLLTGLNVGHVPADENRQPEFELAAASGRSLPDMLWLAGYSTAFVGVWRESTLPLEFGCDEWSGLVAATRMLDPYPEYLYLDGTKARLLPNADEQDGLPVADFLLDEALACLMRRAAEGRPCFVHLALSPRLMPQSDAVGLLSDAASAQLAGLDARLGRFLAQLDELELANRTCVLISGELAPEAPPSGSVQPSRTGALRMSADGLGEGNLRVPLLVRWPGHIVAGSVSRRPFATWDLLPTLADLAGAQRRPLQLDGLSFAPELLGRPQRDHALLYWETREGGFGQAVRKENWKGVRTPLAQTLKLYDLSVDPGEQTDLALQHPEIVEQFRAPGR